MLLLTTQLLSQERAYKFETLEAKLDRGDTLIFTNIRKHYHLILALMLSASSSAQIMISDKGYNPPADIEPPPIPSGLNGVAISDDSLLIYGYHSASAAKFVVWFFGAVKDSTSNDSIYIGGLKPYTTYGFRVLAVDVNGNRSAYCDSIQRTTLDTVTSVLTKPAAPTSLIALDSLDGVDLRATPNPPNATAYVIVRDGAEYDTLLVSPPQMINWTDTDTKDGIQHSYYVYGYNAAGDGDPSNTVVVMRRSSNTYYFSNAGSDNGDGSIEYPFKTIGKLNSLWLNGKNAKFQNDHVFKDAVLICQEGVTYSSYGTSKAIIGDSTSTAFSSAAVTIDVENVTLHNLKIYGYKNASKIIEFSKGNWTLDSCEIAGGQNFHANSWTYGIYQNSHVPGVCSNVTITKNNIHGIGFAAIYWAFPYNTIVEYNEIHDLWMKNGKANWGGCAVANATTEVTEDGEDWDCNYTVIWRHNKIYNFEYATLGVPSRGIIENNEICYNLDERLYFGGVKHGDVGKLWDGYGLGQIFRYNYIHDIYIRGEAGYTYDTPTDAQRLAGTPNVVSTSNGTDHPIYLNAGGYAPGVAYGVHFGDETGEAPENLLGGQGYGNFWIHNNIFYNCTKGITDRGTSVYKGTSTQLPYDSTKTCYLLNNTIVNCGIWIYGAPYGSLVFSHAAAQSPQKSMNNIYHFGDPNSKTAIYYWEKDSYSHNDIFMSPLTSTHYGTPDEGDNFAITGNYSGTDISIEGEQYNKSVATVWNDTSATIFCPTIGIYGAYIPDVRIKTTGEAYNTGKPYSQLGDAYTINSVLVEWSDTHVLGEDPSGRSFAYDIFGVQRTLNHIGAVKAVGE